MELKAYEAMLIVPATLETERVNALLERFSRLITDNGGVVEEARVWDKRKLAYEIRNLKEGIYLLIRFRGDHKLPAELSRVFRITEEVVRARIFQREEEAVEAGK